MQDCFVFSGKYCSSYITKKDKKNYVCTGFTLSFFFLGPLLSHQPRRWIVDKCMFEELEELVDLYLNFN